MLIAFYLVIHFGISGFSENVGTMRRRAFLKISDSVVSRWSLHVKFCTVYDADGAVLQNVKTGDEKNVLKEWVGLQRAGGLSVQTTVSLAVYFT